MTKRNLGADEAAHRQYLIHVLQLNAFSELSKKFSETFAKWLRPQAK